MKLGMELIERTNKNFNIELAGAEKYANDGES